MLEGHCNSVKTESISVANSRIHSWSFVKILGRNVNRKKICTSWLLQPPCCCMLSWINEYAIISLSESSCYHEKLQLSCLKHLWVSRVTHLNLIAGYLTIIRLIPLSRTFFLAVHFIPFHWNSAGLSDLQWQSLLACTQNFQNPS